MIPPSLPGLQLRPGVAWNVPEADYETDAPLLRQLR